MDANGKPFSRELTGLNTIVAQHEFRHLLGGSYQDHSVEFHSEMEFMGLMIQKKEYMFEVCDERAPFLLDDYQVGESIEQYSKRKKGK